MAGRHSLTEITGVPGGYYPTQAEMIRKNCEFCGLPMVVNNWPDKKSRTPKIFDMVICVDCDPRHPDDYYSRAKKPKILHPRKLKRVRAVRLVALLAQRQCGHEEHDPRCFNCQARRIIDS